MLSLSNCIFDWRILNTNHLLKLLVKGNNCNDASSSYNTLLRMGGARKSLILVKWEKDLMKGLKQFNKVALGKII